MSEGLMAAPEVVYSPTMPLPRFTTKSCPGEGGMELAVVMTSCRVKEASVALKRNFAGAAPAECADCSTDRDLTSVGRQKRDSRRVELDIHSLSERTCGHYVAIRSPIA